MFLTCIERRARKSDPLASSDQDDEVLSLASSSGVPTRRFKTPRIDSNIQLEPVVRLENSQASSILQSSPSPRYFQLFSFLNRIRTGS